MTRVLHACQRETLGRDNRAASTKALILFDFVESQLASDPKSSWRELLKRWNAEFPDWRLPDARHFRRDHMRVQQLVILPKYKPESTAVAVHNLTLADSSGARSPGQGE